MIAAHSYLGTVVSLLLIKLMWSPGGSMLWPVGIKRRIEATISSMSVRWLASRAAAVVPNQRLSCCYFCSFAHRDTGLLLRIVHIFGPILDEEAWWLSSVPYAAHKNVQNTIIFHISYYFHNLISYFIIRHIDFTNSLYSAQSDII